MEGRELDAVTVYFAEVEVFSDSGDFGGGDVVGGAPDAFCGLGVLVWERGPVCVVYEGYDAARVGGCAAVVFAGGELDCAIVGGMGCRREGLGFGSGLRRNSPSLCILSLVYRTVYL